MPPRPAPQRLALALALVLGLSASAHGQINTLSLPDTSGVAGQTMQLTVTGGLQTPVTGLTFSLLFDPAVLQIESVAAAGDFGGFALQTNLTSGRLRVAMAGANAVSGSGAVLDLEVLLSGSAGATSKLDLASAVLNEGMDDVDARDGLLTIVRRARIGGTVTYRVDSRAVPTVTLLATDLSDGTVVQATTGVQGTYGTAALAPGHYVVRPSRNTVESDAIDVLDVSDILRDLVGLAILSHADRQAADVSGNGRVGTTDASLILRYLVGLEYEFPAGSFWQFDPAETSVNLLADETRNFTAYLLGDVDGNWGVTPGGAKRAGGGPSLRFLDPEAADGRLVRMSLAAADLAALRGGQVWLSYEPQHLEAVAVNAAALTQGFLVAANLDEPGLVRIAFAGADESDGSGPLLQVDFRERGAAGVDTWVAIDSASLNGGTLPTAALDRLDYVLGTAHGELPTVVAEPGAAAAAATLLAPAYPNPFNGATILDFQVRDAGPVSLTIYGIDGRRVRRLAAGERAAGAHRVVWDARDDDGRAVASGPYLVRLRSGATTATRAVILVR